MMVRILLADDHEIVRQGLRALLEARPGWAVVGEAPDGRKAVEMAKRLKPELVVMDITMPELNGLEAARQILNVAPKTEILILTVHESEEVAHQVLEAGARGYVLKSDAGRDLVAAVESLLEHKLFFTPRVRKMILRYQLKDKVEPEAVGAAGWTLTALDREIVQLLAAGKKKEEVAAAMNISVKAAETRQTDLMRKLKFQSLSDLVHYAARRGIIEA